MIQITRRYEWDMGHRLMSHRGKCRNIHGHRYAAEVTVAGELQESGSESGMVLDFGALDRIVQAEIEPLDHALVLQAGDPIEILLRTSPEAGRLIAWDVPPTAEHIAGHLADLISIGLPSGVKVKAVRVYETPRSWADWSNS